MRVLSPGACPGVEPAERPTTQSVKDRLIVTPNAGELREILHRHDMVDSDVRSERAS